MIGRYILAVALSMLVLIGFQRFFAPQPQPPAARQQAAPAELERGFGDAEPRRAPAGQEPAARAGAEAADAPRWNWGPGGRQLESVVLPDVTPLGPASERSEAYRLLSSPKETDPGALALALDFQGGAPGAAAPDWPALASKLVWTEVPREGEALDAQGQRSWVHRAEARGLELTRTVTVAGREELPSAAAGQPARHLTVRFKIANLAAEERTFRYRLFGAAGMQSDAVEEPGSDLWLVRGSRVRAPSGTADPGTLPDPPRHLPASALEAGGWEEEPAAWVGAMNARFLAALYQRPASNEPALETRAVAARNAVAEGFHTGLESGILRLAAGESLVHNFGFYAGPRDPASLAAYEPLELARSNLFLIDVSPRYRALVDTGRGALSGLYLLEYREEVGRDSPPYRLLLEPVQGAASLGMELELDGGRMSELWRAPWGLRLEERDGLREIVLSRVEGSLLITKRIRQGLWAELPAASPQLVERLARDQAGAHHLRVVVEVRNISPAADSELSYRLFGPVAVASEDLRSPGVDIEFAYGIYAGGTVHTQVLPSKLKDGKDERSERIAWVGISNSYFTSIFFPRSQGGKASFIDTSVATSIPDPAHIASLAAERGKSLERLGRAEIEELSAKAYKNLRAGFTSSHLRLLSGEQLSHEYGLFLGPRDSKVLELYQPLEFHGVNDYGMFSSLVKFFIWLLVLLKTVTFGSWGLAIVLLTVLVKLCLHPINRRSQGSMMRFQKKFQKIQPEMKRLQEQYANDRTRLNREIQKLWKEHGVNPAQQMAGCLILLLQLPIWFGLYKTLQYAIGLRQASFLYIEDLTRPDHLFSWGVQVPFLGEYFNLLPILYVILTVVNQRLQPRPTDPNMLAQYKMMTFLMVFFGFIFYSFPAGFMLYIMTSSALGIVESKIIKKVLAKEEETAAAQSPSGAAPAPAAALAAYPLRPKSSSLPASPQTRSRTPAGKGNKRKRRR
jgi:YidC/Oxa1 family membrane protein insertase